jgi:hypothetical protein
MDCAVIGPNRWEFDAQYIWSSVQLGPHEMRSKMVVSGYMPAGFEEGEVGNQTDSDSTDSWMDMSDAKKELSEDGDGAIALF